MQKNLILILGDQLSSKIPSLEQADKHSDCVLMVEVSEEAAYVRHHKKKIAFIFSAMRHFADELIKAGWIVDYVRLDEPENSGSFTGEQKRALIRHQPNRVVVTEASEWRILEAMRNWEK